MQIFRGYVPTKDKQCLEKFKGRKRLNTLEDVADLDEYAGILGAEAILIDVDDAETSDLLFQIVQDFELKCRVYQTTRGKHFIFKNPEGLVEKSWTKKLGGIPSICMDLVMNTARTGNIRNWISTSLLRMVSFSCFRNMVTIFFISHSASFP